MGQFVASEKDFADYLEVVLTMLPCCCTCGALLWCYSDFERTLFDKPPLDKSMHERYFGLIRSDGSLKPHAHVVGNVLKDLTALKPYLHGLRKSISQFMVSMDLSSYNQNPSQVFSVYYAQFVSVVDQELGKLEFPRSRLLNVRRRLKQFTWCSFQES